jgi:hypothetical protein
MMDNTNKKKFEQLGEPIGTATNRLRKNIMFSLVQAMELDTCFRCGKKIENVENFSIEHKIAWMDSENPKELFFDLDNIAFSHLKCNIGAAYHPYKGITNAEHGTLSRYNFCKCDLCVDAKKKWNREYMRNKRKEGKNDTENK